jgi:hypothetical protein
MTRERVALYVLMRVCVALAVTACLLVVLAGCTSVNGTVYRVQHFRSGSCYVYAKGTAEGVTYFKAIRVARDTTRAKCHDRHRIGDKIRFSVDDTAYQEDQ